MKCRYAGCKLGGNVEKKDAVYLKKAYYHRECYREKRMKERIRYTLKKKYKLKDPFASLNKKLNEYCNLFESRYVLFLLTKNVKLNSIHGLIYHLNDKRNSDKYKKRLAKRVKFNKCKKIEDKPFTYKRKKKKLWGDILTM